MKYTTLILAFLLAMATQVCYGLQADFDSDGDTDFEDFLTLSGNFGQPGTFEDGDANGNGTVDFADFLLVSAEFGQGGGLTINSLAGLQNYNNNGFPSNKEIMILEAATSQFNDDISINGVSNSVFCFAGELNDDVLITVSSSSNVEIVNVTAEANHPIPPLAQGGPDTGNSEFYGDNVGVINIVDSNDVILRDSMIANTKLYITSPAGTPATITIPRTTGVAVNVSRSRNVDIVDCKIESTAKSALMVHSNSSVDVTGTAPAVLDDPDNRSRIKANYFELNVAGSQVNVSDTELIQQFMLPNGDRDSHAAINVTATPLRFGQPSNLDVDGDGNDDMVFIDKNEDGNVTDHVFKTPTTVVLTDVAFNLKTGRPIVSGNSAYHSAPKGVPGAQANVTLTRPVLRFFGPVDHGAYGLVGYAKGWDSIELTVNQGDVFAHTDEASGGHTPGFSQISSKLVNFITTNNPVADPNRHPEEGLGRFVHYQNLDAFGEIERPGVRVVTAQEPTLSGD